MGVNKFVVLKINVAQILYSTQHVFDGSLYLLLMTQSVLWFKKAVRPYKPCTFFIYEWMVLPMQQVLL